MVGRGVGLERNKRERPAGRKAGLGLLTTQRLRVLDGWPIKVAAVIRTARADHHRGPESISIIKAEYICAD
jgi:hypothetical protein